MTEPSTDPGFQGLVVPSHILAISGEEADGVIPPERVSQHRRKYISTNRTRGFMALLVQASSLRMLGFRLAAARSQSFGAPGSQRTLSKEISGRKAPTPSPSPESRKLKDPEAKGNIHTYIQI